MTVSGSAAGYDDTGKILDTGGVDQAGCPLDGRTNESFGWRPIGTTGLDHPGNDLSTPEPSTVVLTASGLLMVGGMVRRRRSA